jgi:hypothetical protein
VDATADDDDLYILNASYNFKGVTVGAYGMYYDFDTYPGNVAPANLNRATFWWAGAYMDGKVGPVLLNFDFVYDDGEVKASGRRNLAHADRTVDYSGWAVVLKAQYLWERFTFGGKFLYASGSDLKDTSNSGTPGTANAYPGTGNADKVSGYVIPPSSETFGAFGEDIVFYGTWMDRGGFGNGVNSLNAANQQVGRGTFGGTWFAKLWAGFNVVPEFKVTAQALYIGDTTKNGNTVGTAVRTNGNPRDDSDIGIELDLITEYMIYKSLKWSCGFGYLFAGDALDMREVGPINHSMKDPWKAVTMLTYTF